MMTDASEPYTREYRVECPIKAENPSGAPVMITAVDAVPGKTGSRGFFNGAEKR